MTSRRFPPLLRTVGVLFLAAAVPQAPHFVQTQPGGLLKIFRHA